MRLRFVAVLLAGIGTASCSSGSVPTVPSAIPQSLTDGPSRSTGPDVTPRGAIDVQTGEVGADEDGVDAAATTVTITGVVTDKAYPAWKISSATVTVTPGSMTTKTTSTGTYVLKLRPGTYALKFAKTGYTTTTVKKTVSKGTLVNVPLPPIKPSGATARCKDRTWSFSQTRRGTCSSRKGVAYWVCPGKLCAAVSEISAIITSGIERYGPDTRIQERL